MAVVSAKYLWSTCSEAEDGSITYEAQWQVLTNSRSDGPRTALAASDLPKRGSTFDTTLGDTDSNASCRTRSVALESAKDTMKKWVVSLNYSTKGSTDKPDNTNAGDPIDWDWKLKLGCSSRMVAPDRDRNNRPFVNTALEPFLPPPESEEKLPSLILTKNNISIPLMAYLEAPGKVNSVAMWGAGVRLFKLADWQAVPHWIDGGRMYWEMTLVIDVRWGGHYFQPPNLGHRELFFNAITAQVEPRAIVDELFMPIARPWPLGIFGEKLDAGVPAIYFDQAAGPMRKFEIEDEYDLSTILPATLPGNFT